VVLGNQAGVNITTGSDNILHRVWRRHWPHHRQ
jgi:hypothetical protein